MIIAGIEEIAKESPTQELWAGKASGDSSSFLPPEPCSSRRDASSASNPHAPIVSSRMKSRDPHAPIVSSPMKSRDPHAPIVFSPLKSRDAHAPIASSPLKSRDPH